MIKKNLLLFFLTVSPIVFSQVGIGTTTPRAALEINSTTTGFLTPQLALTITTASAPVINPAGGAVLAGTIVYNTATANDVTPGYYYWNGTVWVRMAGGTTTSTSHNTLENAYNEGGPGAGSLINADAGAVFINNINTDDSGLIILNNTASNGYAGLTNFVVNDNTIGVTTVVNANGVGLLVDHEDTNNPYSGVQVTNYSANGPGILSTTNAVGAAIAVEADILSNAPNAMTVRNFRTGGGAGIDVIGAIGVRSLSQTATGSAFAGYLNANQGAAGQFNGTGTSSLPDIYSPFSGNQRYGVVARGNPVGIYSSFTSNYNGAAYTGYSIANNSWWAYAAIIDGYGLYDAYYSRASQPKEETKMMLNVVGPGINATTIKSNDKTIIMPSVSAPESLFQDYGTGRLENGRAKIMIHSVLTENILVDKEHPLKVFIQLEGECNGVYVTNKSATGFEVIELANGTSNIEFSYSIIASRATNNVTAKDGSMNKFNAPNRFMTIDTNTEEMQLLQEEKSEIREMKKLESKQVKKLK